MLSKLQNFSLRRSAIVTAWLISGTTLLSSPNAFAGVWPVFSDIGTAGVMCTSLPQDSTPRWDDAQGRLVVFDDVRPGKDLCYISLSGKPETVSITVTGSDGKALAGSGTISIDVTPTYLTKTPTQTDPVAAFTLTSSAFANNGTIPVKYTCDVNKDAGIMAAFGTGAFPPLTWSNVPKGTQSFALLVEDTSADYVHGVFYNIPAATTSLPDDWNMQGASIGVNDFGNMDADQNGYGGPCPPAKHTYEYRLYALDSTLALQTLFPTDSDIETAMQGKILGQTTLTGLYGPRQVK